jgi:hypothetical protein
MCKHVGECLLHEISNLEWINCVLKWIKKCRCESICVEVLIYIYIYRERERERERERKRYM